MSDRPFFDTTVLIYAISEGDRRAEIAEKLLIRGGFISVQVLNEFVAVARRKLKMQWKQITEGLDAIRSLCGKPTPLTIRTHQAALAIAAKYGYQIYDALILAAAVEAKCDTLYSEDMQDGQKIGGLTIRNPFTHPVY
ncbi:PIN domain-containing protein [Alloacidobacterium sp.]|uniref:PIN domain-containing protein n=1 Tax=Alloacidobacterium sp. TaxID=2951999 RepID=UPI002D57C419|nr:PIN domain-containing protein [Alloacidobacterium sp.]HYK35999.1 PIN domain-containing protein [Alloacidobacterium sp.]